MPGRQISFSMASRNGISKIDKTPHIQSSFCDSRRTRSADARQSRAAAAPNSPQASHGQPPLAWEAARGLPL